MGEKTQGGMAEAARLTRQGRLAEATAVIQRALGGASLPDADRTLRPEAPSRPGPTNKRALRRAPEPPRRFRGMPRLPGDASGAQAGGRFVERSYTNRAGTRAYKLYVPSGYVGQEVPLIVMLHGCTQTADDLAAGTLMNALAETHTFLVVYPVQAAAANSSRCWNWFKGADQRRGLGEPSIIAGITCEVLGEYHVDPRRVYLAGMSAGGAMAAVMGEAYPDLYAAIGVHSGLAPGAAHDLPSAFATMRQGGAATARRDASTGKPTRIVPAIVFHGDRDSTVHPSNAERLLAHYRAAANGALRVTTRRGRVPGGYAYTCATHRDAGGRAIVERWTVHGLGHAWSGGSLPGSYTDPRGPDASAEMVRFFQQHPRRGSGGRPAD
jgi:poly(hydroxyalkanoate) depolymerase family esterase